MWGGGGVSGARPNDPHDKQVLDTIALYDNRGYRERPGRAQRRRERVFPLNDASATILDFIRWFLNARPRWAWTLPAMYRGMSLIGVVRRRLYEQFDEPDSD
eukprot:tig00000681_g3133.t1